MDLGLNGRTAVVTGGSKGLGFATVQALIDAATPVVHEANIQRIILAGASFVRDQDLRSHVGQKLSTSGKDTIELRLIPERELEMRSAARAIALDRCIAHPVAS